jgi:hypothetical protein
MADHAELPADDQQGVPGPGQSDPNNGLRQILESTERVEARIDAALGDHLDAIYFVAGILPNATRRLITELEQHRSSDHCAVFHTSRVSNNTLATLMLIRKGMLVEAITMLRSTLEAAAQGMLLMSDNNLAEA